MSAVRIRAGLLAVALVVNLFVANFFAAPSAHACSCAQVPLQKHIKTAAAVFSGEVVGIEPGETASDVFPPSLGRVTFDVEESWKGATEESVVVYGHGLEESCGIEFDQGESYLVYAYRSGRGGEGPLQTGLCDSTKPLEQADDDLLVLAEGSLPDTGGYGFSAFEDAATLTAVCALLALAGALVLRRRTRRPL